MFGDPTRRRPVPATVRTSRKLLLGREIAHMLATAGVTQLEAARMLVEMMGRLEVGNGGAAEAYRAADEGDAPVDEIAKQLYVKIKDAETSADSITHETIKRLRK